MQLMLENRSKVKLENRSQMKLQDRYQVKLKDLYQIKRGRDRQIAIRKRIKTQENRMQMSSSTDS